VVGESSFGSFEAGEANRGQEESNRYRNHERPALGMFSAKQVGAIAFHKAGHRVKGDQPAQIGWNRAAWTNNQAAIHPEVEHVADHDREIPILHRGRRDETSET